jgi:hypothetical protein
MIIIINKRNIMPRKNYEKTLRTALQDAGIYEPRLESQIALTARLEKMMDKAVKALDGMELSYEVIQSNGTERQEVSPLLDKCVKLADQLQDAYTALGLNYNSRSANIRESVRKDEDANGGGMREFLLNLES